MKFKWSVYSDYDYASTQVNLSSGIAKRIMDWGRDNISDEELSASDENEGREDTPHVTLLYGIVDQSPQPIIDLLQGKPQIQATLGKISLFENDDYDVVKIEVESEELHEYRDLLWDEIEHENDFPEYKPHVTIAYVKPGSGSLYSGSTEFEGTRMTFDTVIFSNKEEEATEIRLSVAAGLNWSV